MVSKARDDLPLPLRPVITVSASRGMATSIFFRLCTRAPYTCIWSVSDVILTKTMITFKSLFYHPSLIMYFRHFSFLVIEAFLRGNQDGICFSAGVGQLGVT